MFDFYLNSEEEMERLVDLCLDSLDEYWCACLLDYLIDRLPNSLLIKCKSSINEVQQSYRETNFCSLLGKIDEYLSYQHQFHY